MNIIQVKRTIAAIVLVGTAAALMVGMPYIISGYYAWQGDQFQRTGHLKAAAVAYRKALTIHPSTATMVKLGRTYAKANQPRAAVKILQQAVKMAPQDPVARYDLAVNLLKAGDVPRAKQQLSTVVKLDERNGMAHLALSTLAQQEGNKPLALHELQMAVDNGANTAEAHLRLGEVYFSKNDPRAEREFQEAISTDSACAPAHLRLGYLLMSKNPSEAARHLESALDLGLNGVDDRARALAGLALLAYRANSSAESSTYLHQAADLHPSPMIMASLDYGIGVLRREAVNPDGAAHSFMTAVKDKPGIPMFQTGPMIGQLGLYGEAQLALRDGRLFDAERDFKALQVLDPRNPEYHLGLGTTLLTRNDLAGARNEFSMTVQLAPRNPEAWLNLSATLLQDGRGPESSDAISHALRLAPQWTTLRPDVDVLLGKIDLACNRPQAAELCFRFASDSHSPTVNQGECAALLQTAVNRSQQLAAETQMTVAITAEPPIVPEGSLPAGLASALEPQVPTGLRSLSPSLTAGAQRQPLSTWFGPRSHHLPH